MNTNKKGCKILHIDDDPDDQQLFKSAIKRVDAYSEIVVAENGAEGIEYLLLMKEQNTLPCIIVLDINMPKVNGRETCLAIKKDDVLAAIPLIIFSTSNSALDRLFFENKDVVYITKPTEFDQIVEVANELLDKCECD
jgi:CheY-like chemotaxis protein